MRRAAALPLRCILGGAAAAAAGSCAAAGSGLLEVRAVVPGEGARLNFRSIDALIAARFWAATAAIVHCEAAGGAAASEAPVSLGAALAELEETLRSDNFWSDLARPVAVARRVLVAEGAGAEALDQALEVLQELHEQLQALKSGSMFEQEARALSAILVELGAARARSGSSSSSSNAGIGIGGGGAAVDTDSQLAALLAQHGEGRLHAGSDSLGLTGIGPLRGDLLGESSPSTSSASATLAPATWELRTVRSPQDSAGDNTGGRGVLPGLGPGGRAGLDVTMAPGATLHSCLAYRGCASSAESGDAGADVEQEAIELRTLRVVQRPVFDETGRAVGSICRDGLAEAAISGSSDVVERADATGILRPLAVMLAENSDRNSTLRSCFAGLEEPHEENEGLRWSQDAVELKTWRPRRSAGEKTIGCSTGSVGSASKAVPTTPLGSRSGTDGDGACGAEPSPPLLSPTRSIGASLRYAEFPEDQVLYSSLVKQEEDLVGPPVPSTSSSGGIGVRPESVEERRAAGGHSGSVAHESTLESSGLPFRPASRSGGLGQHGSIGDGGNSAGGGGGGGGGGPIAAVRPPPVANAWRDDRHLHCEVDSAKPALPKSVAVASGMPASPASSSSMGSPSGFGAALVADPAGTFDVALSQGTSAPSAVTTCAGSPWSGAFAGVTSTVVTGNGAASNSSSGRCVLDGSALAAGRNDMDRGKNRWSIGEDELTSARRPGGVEVIIDTPMGGPRQRVREHSQDRSSLRAPRSYSAPRRSYGDNTPIGVAATASSDTTASMGSASVISRGGVHGSSGDAGGVGSIATAGAMPSRRPPRGPPLPPGSSAVSASSSSLASSAQPVAGSEAEAPRTCLRSASRNRPGTSSSTGSAGGEVGQVSRRSVSAGPAARRPSTGGVQSNRKLVRNALERYCLKGDANKAQRDQILQAFDTDLRGTKLDHGDTQLQLRPVAEATIALSSCSGASTQGDTTSEPSMDTKKELGSEWCKHSRLLLCLRSAW
mmetsp:Transcript_84644/g.273618  ORF Transcript_84644/g.273618 Transcript_84644/m.273618 type:complete len:1004 (-) Transcript_84644:254-3265(-)